MAKRVVTFDNGYTCHIDDNLLTDHHNNIIANLRDVTWELSLNLSEMTEGQIWSLCKPIMSAHKKGLESGKAKVVQRLLYLLDAKDKNDYE